MDWRRREAPHIVDPELKVHSKRNRFTSRAVLETLLAARNSGQISFLYDRLQESKETGTLADAVAAILPCDIRQKQDILETGDVVSRLQTILALMKTDQQAA